MAEELEDVGIYWSARIDLTSLEDDAQLAQAVIDRLFERNKDRTLNLRLNAAGADPLEQLGSPGFAPSPAAAGALRGPGSDIASSIPGLSFRGDIQPLVAHVDTTEIDTAQAKVDRLLSTVARAGSLGGRLGSSIELVGNFDPDAGLAATPARAGDGLTGALSTPRWAPAGFRKRDIERKFLAAYESQGGGYTVDDEQRLEEATQGAGDPFTFSGERLPGEVRNYLAGAPGEVRKLFRLARPGQRSGGPEAMAQLGEEEYFSIAERIAGTPLRSAIAAAANSDDPEIQFLADYYKNLPTRGSSRSRLPLESVDPRDLQTGESFTIGGRRHTITEPDEDDRRLTNEEGLDVPLAGLRKLPIDEGSRRRPRPVDLSDEPLAAPRTPRLTPSDAARVFGPTLGSEEELQPPSAGGGRPPLEPPSSRTFDFGDENPSSGLSGRFGSGGRGGSLRPLTPQEARGMTRADIEEPLPEAIVLDGEPGDEGGGTGGGGRGRSFLGRGFSRRFTGGFLLYEGLRVAEGVHRYGRELTIAGNDPLEQLNAEQTLQNTVSGVPLIGQAADLISDGVAESQGFGRVDTEIERRRAKLTDEETDILTRIGEQDRQTRRRAEIALSVDPSEGARREAQAAFDTANEGRLRLRREAEAKAAEDRRLADIAVENRAKELENANAAGRTEAVDSPVQGDFGRAEGLAANLSTYNEAITAAKRSYEQAIAPDQAVLDRALSDISFNRQQQSAEFRIGTEALRGGAAGVSARAIERGRRRSTQELERRPLERKEGLAAPGSVEFQEVDETLSDLLDRQAAENAAAEHKYGLEDRNARFNADTATGELPFLATGDAAGLRRFDVGRSALQGVTNAIGNGRSFPEILAAIQTGGAAILGNELSRNLDVGRTESALTGDSNVLAAELARDPLGVQTARIESRRLQAIESARGRGVLTDDVEQQINRNATSETRLATQQFTDRRQLIGRSLDDQLESSQLQESGSFESANAANIANAAIERATSFSQQGDEVDAQKELTLGQSQLRGFQRNFARSFRGEGEQDKYGVNLTHADTGYEQVTDVFAEVQKKQGQIASAQSHLQGPSGNGSDSGSSGDAAPKASQVDDLLKLLQQFYNALTQN